MVYSYLLIFHSIIRWIVLIFLLYSILRAGIGIINRKPFSHADDNFRHWTATIAHVQMMTGVFLYLKSPVVKYFWTTSGAKPEQTEAWFFPILHLLLMVVAVVILTIGSALAKRKATDKEKFRTMLTWFSLSLLIILIAIPWPFSPLVNRPYLRLF